MYRAALADELRAELLENRIYGKQDAPESSRGFRIVGIVLPVLIEANGIGNFDRHRPDLDIDSSGPEHGEAFLVKLGHGAGLKRKFLHNGIAGFKNELVMDEVEAEFE